MWPQIVWLIASFLSSVRMAIFLTKDPTESSDVWTSVAVVAIRFVVINSILLLGGFYDPLICMR